MKQKLFSGILLTVAMLCWTPLALQAADAPSKAEVTKEATKKVQADKKADVKKSDVQKTDAKKDAPKKDDVKKSDAKKTDAKKDATKKDDVKKSDAKKTDAKKDAPKKDDVKKSDAKKTDAKKDAPKKDDVKKSDAKKSDAKKDALQKADKITKLLRYPDIYGNEVVFTYAGDLWKAPISGGTATRLTAHEGLELFGKFSPDGKWIAFTSQYDGDEQVYIIPSEGGIPKQLTYYPIAGPNPPRRGYDHQVLGWTHDSKKVLFRSGRDSNNVDQLTHIYQIDINGGLPEKLPVPSAGAGDLSLDGKKLVYSPLYRDFRHWKRYEGGWAQYLNIYDLDKKTFDKIPTTPRTDRDPMWLGKDVWFVSDREATLNLYRYDTENKKVIKETNYKDWDVRWASSDGREKIVYELGGELHVYDSKLKKDQKLNIYVPHDGLAMRPGRINVMKNIETLSLAPQAKRAVISARGDIFTVPADKGNIRNLTKSSNAHDRAAVWSPNGKWIAWISDKTGEDQIWITDQLGQKTALPLTENFKVRLNDLDWASDSKALSFWDAHSKLYVLTLKDSAEKDALPARDKIINVANAKNETPFHTAWSPDGKYLAYTLNTENDYTTIYIWDKVAGKSHKITDSMFDSFSPAWDPNGDWLFFISSREFYPQLSTIEWNYAGNRFNGLFAVALRKDVKNIFAPESDEAISVDEATPNDKAKTDKAADKNDKAKTVKAEKDKVKADKKEVDKKDKSDRKDKDGKVEKEKSKKSKKADKKATSSKNADASAPEKKAEKKIDFNGIAGRAIRIPVTSENYQDLSAAGNFLYYIKYDAPFYGRASAEKPVLKAYDLKQKKESTFLTDVSGYDISPDGSKILVAQGPSFKIFSVGPGAGPDAKPLNTAGLYLNHNPSEEWNEVFEEVWRRFRDYFYVKNMHGVDWEKIGQQYRQLLPYVAHRSDLTYILTEMISELNIGHTYVDGGDFIIPDRAVAGLAGAEFVLDKKAGLYKISKIYKGHNQEEKYRSPLTEVGVNVKPGDYLFEIDGEKLTAHDNPYRLLTNKSGSVSWKIGSKADGSDARTIVYKPIANESNLRYLNFVLDRMDRVNKASQGRIGYIHIPDMGGNGGYEFIKWYYPQIRKEGLIIDDRNNGGGNISSWIIMRLNQKLLGTRFGSDRLSATTYPTIANNAHMVCLINETSASDGDIFPYYFRKSGLGQLIGKRSWGGVVGISSRGPLLDGGIVYVPLSATNDEKGNYIIEGHGVDPDIVVEQNPEAMLKDRDPQLERGIKELLKKIEKDPRKLPKRPEADPDKSKEKVKKY